MFVEKVISTKGLLQGRRGGLLPIVEKQAERVILGVYD